MKDLHELLDLCLAKELIFSLSPEINLIRVYKIIYGKHVFNKSSYYDGELKDYIDDYTTTLSYLIKKVKEYESIAQLKKK